ncbi:hypothetical protein TURU_128635 [Turdus rufiventris]|nr:hypothetical protein TURU_128635 [Turdus rufiventris]
MSRTSAPSSCNGTSTTENLHTIESRQVQQGPGAADPRSQETSARDGPVLEQEESLSFWDDGHQSGHHQHIPLQVASRVPLTALTGVIAGMSSMKSKNVIPFEGPEGTVAKTKPFEAKPCP